MVPDRRTRLVADYGGRPIDRSPVTLGPLERLFSLSERRLDLRLRGFAVTGDGQGFYMGQAVDNPERRSRLVLVQNWFNEFG